MKQRIKKDWFFYGFIFLFIFIISFIDIYGKFSSPNDKEYYIHLEDINVHYTYINQARQGQVTFYNQFTAEKHPPVFFILPFLLGGIIGRIFQVDNFWLYLSLRILFSISLLVFLYYYYSYLFNDDRKAKLAWVLTLFANGLLIEGGAYGSIFQSSYNILVIYSLISIIAILWLTNLYLKKKKYYYSLLVFIILLILAFSHPFDALLIFLVMSLYIIISAFYGTRFLFFYLKHYCLICLAVVLAFAYYLFYFFHYSAIGGYLLNANIPNGGFIWFVKSYFVLIIASIIGLFIIYKEKLGKPRYWLVFCWLITASLAFFLPIGFSLRLSIGLVIPFIVFSVPWFIKLSKNYLTKTLLVFIIVFLFYQSFLIYSQDVWLLLKNKSWPFYLPKEYFKPLVWLKENAKLTDVVLASEKWWTFFPAYSGATVFISSTWQTVEVARKVQLVDWFYRDNSADLEKEQFLKDNNINYIYYSPAEQEKGSYDPSTKDYLEVIYDDGWAQIYKVK